jgi:hypothetical protein
MEDGSSVNNSSNEDDEAALARLGVRFVVDLLIRGWRSVNADSAETILLN